MSEPEAGGDEPDEESVADLDEIAEAPDEGVDAALDALLADEDIETEDVEPDAELIDRVESTDAETIARELAALSDRVTDLEATVAEQEAEIDDLESRLARKQADFQNYKQRQQERLEDEKARATEELIKRLLDVRDNLARALEQDADADIRPGVESTLRQLDEEFERENVQRIEPDPGDETDPHRHEVLMRVDSDRPEGRVVDVHRPGYEMAEKVLRPAQVTVSTGPDAPADSEEEATADGDTDDDDDGAAENETAETG
ncbi:MAG: nucleotide exchange factor GrpE [Salinirussus sp.]